MINNERRTLTVKCGSKKAKLLALDRDTFTRILGSIESYLHLDYSDFCKSIDHGRYDEEESKRNITVNLSALRDDVDGHQIQQQNWTSQSSNELNSALGGDHPQQASADTTSRHKPKPRRSSDISATKPPMVQYIQPASSTNKLRHR